MLEALRRRWEARRPHLRASFRPSLYDGPCLWSFVEEHQVKSTGRHDLLTSSIIAQAFESQGSDKSTNHDYHVPYSRIRSLTR